LLEFTNPIDDFHAPPRDRSGTWTKHARRVRAGYFQIVTHSQALVERALGRFEQALGSGAHIEWKVFNAGPSVIEALFAERSI